MPKCLSKQEIREFLSDQLDDERRESVVDHVEECENCQTAMEKFLGDQTIHHGTNGSTSIGPYIQGESKLSKVTSAIRNRPEVRLSEPLPAGQLPSLAGFKIVGEIGRGASGIVYEAVQEGLERRVAIKLISGQMFNQKDLQMRFLREAKSVATLNHPNIAQLFQISEDSPFGPYLVFEFVDAVSLDERIHQKGTIIARNAVRICRAIVAAANHAHQRHLVHRDLKPSNVLLEKGTRTVKVIDFGLAVDPDQQSRLTLDSFIAGTPAYMSPEQIESPREIDHRSDLYSLGVILYEMLTGDVPFRGLSKKTLYRVVEEEPRPLTTINPDVPADLETICLKLLSKSPDQRYQTMLELDEELLRFEQGKPILAKPVTNLAKAYRWMRRNKLVASLGATVASLVVLVAIVSTYGVWMLSKANAETLAAKQKSDSAAREAIQQRDQLLETIDSLVYDVNDDVDAEYIDQDKLQVILLEIAKRGLAESPYEASSEIARRVGDINLRLATVHIRNHEFELAESELHKTLWIAKNLLQYEPALWDAHRLRSFAKWEQVNMDALRGDLDLAEIGRMEAVRFDQSYDASLAKPQDYYNYLIHRGYALVNLGISYFRNRSATALAIKMLDSVYQDMANIDVATVGESVEEIDSFRYQALGLQQYVVEGLGDCYFSRNDIGNAAKFDSENARINELLTIYEDGEQFPFIPEGIGSDEDFSTFSELPTIQRAERYYLYLLKSVGPPQDLVSKMLVSNRRYHLGNLYALWGKFNQAMEQYNLALELLSDLKPVGEISKFKILVATVKTQIRKREAEIQSQVPKPQERWKLSNLIADLDAVAKSEKEIRILEMLKHDFVKIEQLR